jgi:fibronectin-binding autotransporter adhesin
MTWSGSVTFKGTTNLDLGSGAINVSPGAGFALTLASNILFTEGTLSAANGVGTTVNGPGTWVTGNTLSAGVISLNGGAKFVLNSPLANSLGSGATTTVNAGTLLIISNATGTQILPAVAINVSGGTFDINGDTGEEPTLTLNSGTIQDSGGATGAASAPAVDTLTSSSGTIALGSTNCTLSSLVVDRTLDIPSALTGTGSLNTAGLGTVSLGSTNSFTGNTTIGPGTLALYDGMGSAFLSNSPAIILTANTSALDLSGNTDGAGAQATLTLNPGQILSGFGTVTGLVVSLGGATVAPGSASAIGTLTVTPANGTPGASALNGALLLALNRTNAQTSSSVVFAGGNTVTYGGTLSVTNIGPALHVGDVFHLFPSAVTTFASIQLPTTDASGNAYTWNNNVAVNGSITVASVVAPINPNAGRIQFSLTGATLSLAWPTNGGWILQTNAVGLASTNAWYPYPGSTSLTNVNINISKSQTNVFFRLVYP